MDGCKKTKTKDKRGERKGVRKVGMTE